MAAKMGRPTESIKDYTLRVRMDKETLQMLDDCCKKYNVSRSELVRRGILLIHGDKK